MFKYVLFDGHLFISLFITSFNIILIFKKHYGNSASYCCHIDHWLLSLLNTGRSVSVTVLSTCLYQKYQSTEKYESRIASDDTTSVKNKNIIRMCTAVLHAKTHGQTDRQRKPHYFGQIAQIIHIKDDISKGGTCIKLHMNL